MDIPIRAWEARTSRFLSKKNLLSVHKDWPVWQKTFTAQPDGAILVQESERGRGQENFKLSPRRMSLDDIQDFAYAYRRTEAHY